MRILALLACWLCACFIHSAPSFSSFYNPSLNGEFNFDSSSLCATAKETLAYLAKGKAYDPLVIHTGTVIPIPINKIKETLSFVCENQLKMKDPEFIKKHFNFIRWYPDLAHAHHIATNKPLLNHLPKDKILMTKYYVHLAKGSLKATPFTPYALYSLPKDENNLSLNQAEMHPNLMRFKYGKQAILHGALNSHYISPLVYLNRVDLEESLLQGTVVADFGSAIGKKIFNVHRNNNIPYDKTKNPYAQERYWYFKQVQGIKGYGKDADYKITVQPGVTFAADLEQLGLGKMLMVQYHNTSGVLISQIGILADTGGAFNDNLYQVDFLAGSYPGKSAFYKATRNLPDYVDAYFMVLK